MNLVQVGLDLNYGGLIGRDDLCKIDLMALQSRILVSTDQNALKTYLRLVLKELEVQNIYQCLTTLSKWCEQTNLCTEDDEHIF